MTVVFLGDGTTTDARVLLDEGDLPLPVLASFMTSVAAEQRRVAESAASRSHEDVSQPG